MHAHRLRRSTLYDRLRRSTLHVRLRRSPSRHTQVCFLTCLFTSVRVVQARAYITLIYPRYLSTLSRWLHTSFQNAVPDWGIKWGHLFGGAYARSIKESGEQKYAEATVFEL